MVEVNTSGSEGVALKKIKNELRISKKAEQLAKEKLISVKKQLDKTLLEYAKYKTESESRVEGLKAEVNLLQAQLQRQMADSNDLIERQSQGSGGHEKINSNHDVLKMIEEYSKQNEQKAKELEEMQDKLSQKKEIMHDLKRSNFEMEQKNLRLQSKLENMNKFSKIFIKSMQSQNKALKEQVIGSQRDFQASFEQTKSMISVQIEKQMSLTVRQHEKLLKKEREHVADLQKRLDNQGQSFQETLSKSTQDVEKVLQNQVATLQAKIEKLKQKFCHHEEKATKSTHEVEVLKIQLESEKQKNTITIEERIKEIGQLKYLISEYQQKEINLSKKVEAVQKMGRDEYQRLMEIYESSGRYKELRDLYESKIETKDKELQSLRQSLLKTEYKLEHLGRDLKVEYEKEQAQLIKQIQNDLTQKFELEVQSLKQLLNGSKLTVERLETEQKQFIDQLQLKDQKLQTQTQENLQNELILQQKIEEYKIELKTKDQSIQILSEKISVSLKQPNHQEDAPLPAKESPNLIRQSDFSTENQPFESRQRLESSNSNIQELPEEHNQSDECELQGEILEKQNSPPREFQADLAPKPITQGPRPNKPGFMPRQIRPILPAKEPKKVEIREESPKIQVENLDSQITLENEPKAFEQCQQEAQKLGTESLDNQNQSQYQTKDAVFTKSFQQGLRPSGQPFFPQRPSRPIFTVVGPQQTIVSSELQRDSAQKQDATISESKPKINRRSIPRPQKALPKMNNDPFGMNSDRDQIKSDQPGSYQTKTDNSYDLQNANQAPEYSKADPFETSKMDRNVKSDSIENLENLQSKEIKDTVQVKTEQIKINEQNTSDLQKEQLENQIQRKDQVETIQKISLKEEEEKKESKIERQIQRQDPVEEIKVRNETVATIKEKSKQTVQQETGQQTASGGRFSSMINGLLSYLGRKKETQAFLGKSASKMKFDEIKGRYVFDDESESEEEPIPEPPKARKVEQVKDEVKEEHKELTGTAALTSVAFAGALSNRGRGRGSRGGRSATSDRFASTFSAQNIHKNDYQPTEEIKSFKNQKNIDLVEDHRQATKKKEEVDETNNESFVTSLDKSTIEKSVVNQTQNMTMYTANDQTQDFGYDTGIQNELVMKQLKEKENLILDLQNQIQMEKHWKEKCKKQSEKVQNMSKQVGLAQNELKNEKQQMQMTIEGMETFIAEFKIEGEKFQNEIQTLKTKLEETTELRAIAEFKQMQLADEYELSNRELSILREDLNVISGQLSSKHMEIEMLKLTNQMELLKANQRQPVTYPQELTELQNQRENFEWQKTMFQFERASLVQENTVLMQRNQNLRQELDQSNLHIEKIEDEQKSSINNVVSANREQNKINEKERDNLKELVGKLQAEKERLQEQIKDRLKDKDAQLQKLEQERNALQKSFQKHLQEKDCQWNEKLDKHEVETQNFIRKLEDKIKLQAIEIQKQELKRSTESKRQEKQIKQQLNSLEGILNKKEEDLNNLQGFNEEVTQELMMMGQMREKLNQHIIYLQNEIRKRDELLEEGSELIDVDIDESDSIFDEISSRDAGRQSLPFINEDEFVGGTDSSAAAIQKQASKPKKKTLGYVLKTQLEETRNSLKTQIEQKLRAEVKYRAAQNQVEKLNDGLTDILNLLKSQISKIDVESQINLQIEERKSEQSSQSEANVTVHQIIAKLFQLVRTYEVENMELQHQIDKSKLELEDADNVKFDLEILQDEKSIIEQELDQLRADYESLKKSFELQNAKLMMENQSKQISQLNEQYQQKSNEASARAKQEILKLKSDFQTQLNDLQNQLQLSRDQLDQAQDNYDQMQGKLQETIVELQMANTQTTLLQQQTEELQSLKNQAEDAFERKIQEIQELQSQKEESEFQAVQHINDLVKEFNQVKQNWNIEKKDLQDQIKRLQEEDIALKDQTIAKMNQDIEQIVNQFIEKKNLFKNQISNLKADLKEATLHLITAEETQNEKQTLIDMLNERIDELQRNYFEQNNTHLQHFQEQLHEKQVQLEQNIEKTDQLRKSFEEQLKRETERSSTQMQQKIANFQTEMNIKIDELNAQRHQFESLNRRFEDLSEANELLLLENQQSKSQNESLYQIIDTLKLQFKEQEEKLKETQNELSSQIQEKEFVKEQLNAQRSSNDDTKLDQIVQDIQADARSAIEKIKQKRDAKEVKLRDALTQLSQENESIQEQVEQLRNSLSTVQAELLYKSQEVAQFKEMSESKAQSDEQKKQKLTQEKLDEIVSKVHADAQLAIETLKQKRDAKEVKLKAALTQLSQENESIQEQVEQLRNSLSTVQVELLHKSQELAQFKEMSESKALSDEQEKQKLTQLAIETLKQKRDAKEVKLKDALTQLSQENESIQEQVEQLRNSLTTVQAELLQKSQELAQFKEMIESKQDYDQKGDQKFTQKDLDEMHANAQQAIESLKLKRDAKEAKLKDALIQLSKENESMQKQIVQLRTSLQSAQTELLQKDLNLDSPKHSSESKSKNDELEEQKITQVQLDEIMSKVHSDAQMAIKTLKQKRDAKEAKFKDAMIQLSQENESIQEQLAELRNSLQSAEAELLKKDSVVDSLNSQLESKLQNDEQEQQKYNQEQIDEIVKQVHSDAQQAIENLKQKRDAKEAKLKQALAQLGEDFQVSQQSSLSLQEQLKTSEERLKQLEEKNNQMQEEIERFNSNQDSDLNSALQKLDEMTKQRDTLLQFSLQDLKNELQLQQKNFQETEEYYQQESEKLAATFKQKQKASRDKLKHAKQSLKELFDEHEELKAEMQAQRQQFENEKADYEESLKQQQYENQNLTQSLDLTRVQRKDDSTQFELEQKLIQDQYDLELKQQEKKLRQLLEKIGIEIDASEQSEQIDSFDKLIEKCATILQNYLEDKRQLGVMLQEKEERARKVEDLEFKLERMQAERELIQKSMDESQVGKLKNQISQLEEERSEIRNDFYIKFNSFSEEISVLKGKLHKYEPEKSQQQTESQNLQQAEYKLDQVEEKKQEPSIQKASGGGISGFVASLFLTDSELKGRL